MATQTEALVQLYHSINGPWTAGRKWVTYNRSQVDAMLDVLKQVLVERGCEFGPTESRAAIARAGGEVVAFDQQVAEFLRGCPVAHVPVHPRQGPLWSDTVAAGSEVHRSNSYPLMPLYAAPPQRPESVVVDEDRAETFRKGWEAGYSAQRTPDEISSVLANALGEVICAADFLINRIVETRGTKCVDNMEFAVNGARAAIKKYESINQQESKP